LPGGSRGLGDVYKRQHVPSAVKLAPNLPKLARGFGRNGKH
jgi:hypothetical protein